jgi:hypothetical protein
MKIADRKKTTKNNIGRFYATYCYLHRLFGEEVKMKEQVVRKRRRIVYKKLQKRNSKTVMMGPKLG